MRGIRRNRVQGRRAFTLMELLIVVAILLALVGIVAGFFLNVQDNTDVDLQKVQIRLVDDAMDRFYMDLRRYPTEEEGLAVLWNRNTLMDEADLTRWRGPYLKDPITADKWGTAIAYYNPSMLRPDDAKYDIISFGPDREEGTDDDITNHDRARGEDGSFDTDDFSIGN